MQELSFIVDIKKSGDSCKYFEGTKKYIATADIIDDEIVSYTEVTYANKPSRANVIAKPGDVIFAKMQNTIKVIVVDEETSNYIYSTGFYCIQDDRYLPEFLKCYFMSKAFNEKKDKNCNGATMKALSDEGFKKIKLPLISKEVQKQIIDEYLAISSSIKNKNKQISIFDELIKSQFIEMFGSFENVNLLPLSNCSKFIDYRGQTPLLSDNGTIRMINAKSVGKGFFKEVDEFIDENTYNSWMKRGFAYAGDVLFVTEGHTFGNVCQVPSYLTKFALGQRVITIQGKANLLNNYFLAQYMQTVAFRKDIEKYKTGGTAQGIRSKDLLKISIPIPNLCLQDQFAAIVKQIDKSKLNGGVHCAIC